MRSLSRPLLHLVALGVGLYAMFHPTIDNGFAKLQTDMGDTVLNHYLLEHTWRVVADPAYKPTLWSPTFYYPQPRVFAYSENMFGVAPVYWLLRLALPYDLAFQVWMMVLSVANYAAMAAVLRVLPVRAGERLPPLLVALGGVLWAFGLTHQAAINHPQLIARFWMPPAVYCAWRFVLKPSVGWLHGTLALFFLQVTCCVNTGWFLGLGLVVFVPVAAWAHGAGPAVRAFWRDRRRAVVAALAAWGAATLAFLSPYMIANSDQGRTYGECLEHMPVWSSFLGGPPGSWWYQTLLHVRDIISPETHLFSGFGVYALLLTAVIAVRGQQTDAKVQPGRRLAVTGLIAAGVMLLLTLNVGGGVSLWWFVRLLPGGLAIRAVGRVQIVVYLFLIPAALIGFRLWVQGRWPDGWPRRIVTLAVLAAVVFEHSANEGVAFEKTKFYGRLDDLAALVAGQDAFYLVPREDQHPLEASVLAMWVGMRADVPVVNGYSGRLPRGFPESERLTDEDVRAWLGPAFHGKLTVIDPTEDVWEVRRYVVP